MKTNYLLVTGLILVLGLNMGCAQLGVTSSLRSTFTETTDEAGNIEATVWDMHVRNGLFSKIDETAMATEYKIYADGQLTQEVTQGSDALGMDSTAQVEALTASMDGLVGLTEALAPLLSAL